MRKLSKVVKETPINGLKSIVENFLGGFDSRRSHSSKERRIYKDNAHKASKIKALRALFLYITVYIFKQKYMKKVVKSCQNRG